MRNWESILKSNTLDWLLEKNNPSVRYLTLIDILDFPDMDSGVVEAKNKIMEGKLVSEIFLSDFNALPLSHPRGESPSCEDFSII